MRGLKRLHLLVRHVDPRGVLRLALRSALIHVDLLNGFGNGLRRDVDGCRGRSVLRCRMLSPMGRSVAFMTLILVLGPSQISCHAAGGNG